MRGRIFRAISFVLIVMLQISIFGAIDIAIASEANSSVSSPTANTLSAQSATSTSSADSSSKTVLAATRAMPESLEAPEAAGNQGILYLDGKNGSDDNDGLSQEKPVKTFAKAKEIATANQNIQTIYVLGTVDIEGDISLSGTKAKLVRGEKFKDVLLNVVSGKTATLKDIIVDGNRENIIATSALVTAQSASTLNIQDGAVLQNNKNYKDDENSTRGGGLYAYEASVVMDGGIIQNNQATNGGGVYLNKASKMIMSGGKIIENYAKRAVYNQDVINAAGGGLCVDTGSTLELGGSSEIASNTSEEVGGGISVGSREWGPTNTLVMNGGVVSGNTAFTSGGGIFVQAKLFFGDASKAKINAGKIIDNSCTGKGITEFAFGGGGIYVNGTPSQVKFGDTIYHGANGILELKNALVTDNLAAISGAGYAACSISKTTIYVTNGVALYSNKLTNNLIASGKEIYILSSNRMGLHSKIDGTPYNISERMLGGTLYNWKDSHGQLVTPEKLKGELKGDGSELALYTDEQLDATGKKLATVIISGNTSATRGGGIGSNGTVIFGEDKPLKEVKILKEWDESLTPRAIEVELRGKLSDGTDWLIEKVKLNKENNFSYTVKNLPATVREQKIEDLLYIKELGSEGFKVEYSKGEDKGIFTLKVKNNPGTPPPNTPPNTPPGTPPPSTPPEEPPYEPPYNPPYEPPYVQRIPKTGDVDYSLLVTLGLLLSASGCVLGYHTRRLAS